jgi:hypothetical protein
METSHKEPRNGNRAEPSAHRFLAECSDKRPSTQYLRPNLQPIYQQMQQSCCAAGSARLAGADQRGGQRGVAGTVPTWVYGVEAERLVAAAVDADEGLVAVSGEDGVMTFFPPIFPAKLG